MSDPDLTSAQRAVSAEPENLLARAKLAALEDRLGRPRGSMLTGRLAPVVSGGKVMLLSSNNPDAVVVFLEDTELTTAQNKKIFKRGDTLKTFWSNLTLDEECLP